MNLDMITGFLAGVGLVVSVRTIFEANKKIGIIQMIMTFLPPVFTSLWCMKKNDFVFGGTDWEFIIQTATVDKCPQPWLILLLYVLFVGLTIYNIITIIKRKMDKF